MTLFINNLPCQVTQVEIQKLLNKHGAIKHIFLPVHWKTNQGFGFAFVEMYVKANEDAARFALNNFKWMGNQLEISEISS